MFDSFVTTLERLEPGPFLAVLAAETDISRVPPRARVALLRARQRMASHYEALVLEGVNAVAGDMAGEIDNLELTADAASAEVAAALCLTRRSADAQIDWAYEMWERVPRVAEMLKAGQIDVRRAKTIVSGVQHLNVEVAQKVVDAIAPQAGDLTTGQLAAQLRKLCAQSDPDDAADRYREAIEERRVVVEANPSGTAHLLGMDLPPERVMAVSDRIDRIARKMKAADQSRSMDQLRADIFIDLLEGRSTAVVGGVVDLRVDLDTLAGLTEAPGELAGYGPVVADVARRVASARPRAEWRCTVTDHDGAVIWEGTTKRRPSTALRRGVERRYPTCVFPGCRMPARACDLDHRIPWGEGGVTCECNLAPLCRYHHRIRHEAGWTYDRRPRGDHVWTSPTGAVYTTSGQSP
jgi:hypothetical protein